MYVQALILGSCQGMTEEWILLVISSEGKGHPRIIPAGSHSLHDSEQRAACCFTVYNILF